MLLVTIKRRITLLGMSILFLTMFLPLNMLPRTAFADGSSTASINPAQGMAGAQVTGTGSNWVAGDMMIVQWEDYTNLATTSVQNDGTFSVPFTIPSSATSGAHTVYFFDQTAHYFIPATFTVGFIDLQTLNIAPLQTPYTGYSPTFRAYIRNNGTLASGGFNIQWIVDGNNLYGGHYSIPAGATDTHDHIWHNLTAGKHKLTFIANFDHGVPESNYNNNQVTITFTAKTPNYDPGKYAGQSSSVSIVGYNEPDGSAYYNYCGPGASQVLISNWTSNVPSIDTLATEEKTDPKNGTAMKDMVVPINNAIGQNYYSIHYANSQRDFSNMIGSNILDKQHPFITGLITRYGGKQLNGWKKVKAYHIITIYGFDFTSPTVGYIYYYETASVGAGATEGPGEKTIDYNTFWTLVNQNDIQLSAS